ncbi:MAG TPA: glycosyltransferase family 2 protein [Candidatus Eisenbacteria bacterium]|nr:glycosyltransferase family 2 protein [Candidatus Eisenbacteria bacterium]
MAKPNGASLERQRSRAAKQAPASDRQLPSRPTLSVVIPVFNEEANVSVLYRRAAAVLEDLNLPFEIIFIDDGSSDGTLGTIRGLHAQDSRVRAVSLARNFGHQRAITSGLAFASGDAVIVMDGDLQDPPEVIPRLVAAWRSGYEVAYAIRRSRVEPRFKKAAYSLFYRLMKRAADIDIPLDSGDFALMDRRVVRILNRMPERNRFVRGLRAWVGFRQVGVEYDREARHAGESKYSFNRLLSLALDGLISYSFVPLRLVSLAGVFISFCSLSGMGYLILAKVSGDPAPQGWTSLIVTVLFLGGVQLLALGVLGEYLGRMFEEVKQRPVFLAREVLGFPERPAGSSPEDSFPAGDRRLGIQ